MKIDLDITKTLVFCLVFICVTFLVYAGKLPEEYVKYLFVWLVPSPVQVAGKREGE